MAKRMRYRALTVVAAAATLAATAGCASVEPGQPTSDPQAVARYAAAVSTSRAAARAETVAAVCRLWRSAYEVRDAKSDATTAYTKSSSWDWPGIAPLVSAELAAISTESAALPALQARADPEPALRTALRTYQQRLDAYGAALKSDTAARGEEQNTWPRANPAMSSLRSATATVDSTCQR